MEQSIDLKEKIILQFFKKFGAVLILVSILVGLASSVAYLELKTPVYQSSGQLVQNDNNNNLLNSYKQFISSSKFETLMKKKIQASSWQKYKENSNYTTELSFDSNSPFFTLKVSSSNAKYSIFLANTAMEVLMSNIGRYLSGANISIVSVAKESGRAVSKSHVGMIGMIVAMLVFILLSLFMFAKEMLVGKIKNSYFIEEYYGIKNMGTISISKNKD